jgi:glycerol-3-phosphate dehydrogenase (NAD(P)+)
MANIVILGAGMMGTAISTPLADNGHSIHLVGTHLDTDIIEEIHESRLHPKLRTRVGESVIPYSHLNLEQAMRGVDLVILGINSLGITWAAEQLEHSLPIDCPVIAVTKGLAGDGERLHLLPDVFRATLPENIRHSLQIAAIGGPSIARELAIRRHTSIILTGCDQELLHQLAGLLRTPYYHVWTSTDMVGVEVCVALKNLYSLAVGTVQGILEVEGSHEIDGAMHNLAAAIFAQGLYETAHVVQTMGGDISSVYSLPGAGDLYVTCMGGRNVRMGRWLGLGMGYSEAKERYLPDDTLEGAELIFAIGDTIQAMIESGELDRLRLPLLRTMISIIRQGEPVEIPWDDFFNSSQEGR